MTEHEHTYPTPADPRDLACGPRRCECCGYAEDLMIGRSTTNASRYIVQLPKGRFCCDGGRIVERISPLVPEPPPDRGYTAIPAGIR